MLPCVSFALVVLQQNTSNLLSHLHKHHPKEYNNVSVKPKKSRSKCKQASLPPAGQLTIQSVNLKSGIDFLKSTSKQ